MLILTYILVYSDFYFIYLQKYYRPEPKNNIYNCPWN